MGFWILATVNVTFYLSILML